MIGAPGRITVIERARVPVPNFALELALRIIPGRKRIIDDPEFTPRPMSAPPTPTRSNRALRGIPDAFRL